jgi:hypothetical protein
MDRIRRWLIENSAWAIFYKLLAPLMTAGVVFASLLGDLPIGAAVVLALIAAYIVLVIVRSVQLAIDWWWEHFPKPLAVMRASYGVPQWNVDVTEKVREHVRKNRLGLQVGNWLVDGQDGAVGKGKALMVEFQVGKEPLDVEWFDEGKRAVLPVPTSRGSRVVQASADLRGESSLTAEAGVVPSLPDELDQLAQQMVEHIAAIKRDAPATWTHAVALDPSSEESERAWEAATKADQEHETKAVTTFQERFAVRLAGVLDELRRRELLNEEEIKHLLWITRSSHWLAEIPQTLAAKARELRSM